jgi:hypothetical protein
MVTCEEIKVTNIKRRNGQLTIRWRRVSQAKGKKGPAALTNKKQEYLTEYTRTTNGVEGGLPFLKEKHLINVKTSRGPYLGPDLSMQVTMQIAQPSCESWPSSLISEIVILKQSSVFLCSVN